MLKNSSEEKFVIGLLPDIPFKISNQNDARATKNFKNMSIDQMKYNYFKEYQKRYFYDEFIPGRGTEDILDFLGKYHQEGTLLDLGAGTTSVMWLLAMEKIQSVICADIEIEALKILDEFCHSCEVPKCYLDVGVLLNKTIGDVHKAKNKISEYFVYDILQGWPIFVSERRFDNITGIGLLGITAAPIKFINTLGVISKCLKDGGIYLGADWIRKQHLVEYDGHDSSFLSKELIENATRNTSLELLDFKRVDFQGDSDYQGVFIWAAKKLPKK